MSKEEKSVEKTEGKAVEEMLPGGVSRSQVDAWKKTHGKVFQITVQGDDRIYGCYLHKPDRTAIQASSALASSDPLKSNEILMQNCWLGGDKEIQTNDDLFLSASGKLGKLFQIRQSEIKEL